MFWGKDKKITELEDRLAVLSATISVLEKQNNNMQAILASMVEGVIAVDKDARITSINPSVEAIFGVNKEGVIGRLFLECIRNNDLAEVVSVVLEEKAAVSKELNLSWPVQKVFQLNATPILENGRISGCLLVIHDITEIRKLERIRSDFVANASHELKTPLTSIKGFVETLLEGALDNKEESRNFLNIIQDHTERLNNLINDLLELSHIESGELELKPKMAGIKGIFDEVILGFRSQIRKKKIEIDNQLAEDLKVPADRPKLEQVIINLIDNAIKFNKDSGRIRISSQDLGRKIKIIIEDSGQGVPEKDLPRIFERFYRVDKARSRNLGGTGLGLSIVKHIIELHKGSVGVESTEGLGSKFFFLLPKE